MNPIISSDLFLLDILYFQNLLDYDTFAKLLVSINSKSEFIKKLENLWEKVKYDMKSILQMLTSYFYDERIYVIKGNQNM